MEAHIMDCRGVEFSTEKSGERMERALRIFPRGLLTRIIAFALYLLGAERKSIASVVGMPVESVKTALRVLLRDGFVALRDRRRSETAVRVAVTAVMPSLQISVRREGEWCIVAFGPDAKELRVPIAHKVKVRTILLTLLNAGLISPLETASLLGISSGHCRELAAHLTRSDVPDALVDKRCGQTKDYRVGPGEKAEMIQQLVARIVTGHSVSSEVLADLVNEQTNTKMSPRTIRWHLNKLGLSDIGNTLPELVATLKKTCNDVA
jgi:DNA-binding transcriptional ArsR family regulator